MTVGNAVIARSNRYLQYIYSITVRALMALFVSLERTGQPQTRCLLKTNENEKYSKIRGKDVTGKEMEKAET